MRPSEWVSNVVARAGLTKPDGRPLNQYRLTDEEYAELVKLLKLSGALGLENISQRLLLWDAAFVFYASEWWRRQYAGQWGWEGVFESIGLRPADITINRRNQFIELGLKRWGRDVRIRDGRRQFLGTVATEGGLPLNQLAEGGGWLKNVLVPAVKKHIARNLPLDVLIDAYEHFIPKSYRSPETKQVLEDIAISVVALRQEYNLYDRENPLDWLDNNVPQWWERFPLPLDNDVAKSLLRELITVAGQSQSVEQEVPFALERILVKADYDPELQARMEVPRYVLAQSLPGLNFDNLPSRFEFSVMDDTGVSTPWCRGIRADYNGVPAIRLSGRPFVVGGDRALASVRLQLKSMGDVIKEFPIIEGDALDVDVPWLFKSVGTNWVLHGTASQTISDEEALAYVPSKFTLLEQTETTTVNQNRRVFEGALYTLTGSIRCTFDGEHYRLATGLSDSYTHYYLSGKRFYGVCRPGEIYIGVPQLYEANTLTGSSRRSNHSRLMVKPVGVDTAWSPINAQQMGCYEVRLSDAEGNISWRRRIGLLPENFAYQLVPSETSPLNGLIKLRACNGQSIAVSGANLQARIEHTETDTQLSLSAIDTAPMLVPVALLTPGHQQEVVLNLPYPAKGAILYDPEGQRARFHKPLFLDRLHGYRIRIFDERFQGAKRALLRFVLIDYGLSAGDSRDMYVERRIMIDAQVTDLALIDFKPVIQELLGVGNTLDASVRISLDMNATELFHLNVRRYEYDFQADWDNGIVSLAADDSIDLALDKLEGATVKAIRLHQPEENAAALEPLMSEGCFTGQWNFHPETREEGPWLICPAENSTIQFRPLLWPVKHQESPEEDVDLDSIHILQHAMKVVPFEQREEAIRQVLREMTHDLEHRSWDYLSYLSEATKHLPLPTLDVWCIAVSEPEFLATLLVKSDYDEVIGRLEDELPIIWELVRVNDWCRALSALKAQYSRRLGDEVGVLDDDGREILEAVLDRRIDYIANMSPSMTNMGQILGVNVLGRESKELGVMELPMEAIVKPTLENAFQETMRRNAESQWPVLLSPQINALYQELPEELHNLIQIHRDFRAVTAYMPILLAWRTNTRVDYGWLGRAVNIFKLQQIRNFDEDWFSTAFKFLSAWLSRHSAITEQDSVAL